MNDANEDRDKGACAMMLVNTRHYTGDSNG